MKPAASWPQLTPRSQAAGPGDQALRSGLPEAFPAGFLGGAPPPPPGSVPSRASRSPGQWRSRAEAPASRALGVSAWRSRVGDPAGRPLSGSSARPLPGDLEDTPPLCLSPQSWTLPAASPGDRSPSVGQPRAAPDLAFPVVQGAAQPSLPLAVLLQQANKSLFLSVWLLSQWTGSSWLRPGRPHPCSSAHRGLRAAAPTQGAGSRTWTLCVRLCLLAPGRGGASGCPLWSGGWVPPELCIPAHLLPRPHPGRSWRLFPRASPCTHPHGLGGQRSTSQRLVLGRRNLPTAPSLPPLHASPTASPLLWGQHVETRSPAARLDSRVKNSQPADPDTTRKAWGSRSNSGQCAARGRRPGVSSQDPCSGVPGAPAPLHTGRTLGRKGTEPTDTPRQALPTPALGSPWAGPDLECPVPQVVS